MAAQIEHLAFYLPENRLTNDDLEKEFPDWNATKIEEKVGIKERRIVSRNETAFDLAYHAAERLFTTFDRSKVDFILLCTQSPDYFLPTSACVLQKKLNLSPQAGAFDFNLGCSGFVYGLAVAKGLISAGIAKNILLITSETYSKHIHPADKANRSIFGDGSAASVISSCENEKIFEFSLGTDGAGFCNLIVQTGGMREHTDNESAPHTDEGGNFKSKNHLYMNGPEIFNFTIDNIPPLVEATLKKNNITLEEINYVIFHQANKYMLEYLRKKIKIPKEKYYSNMLLTGNTVSSTIPIALKDSIDSALVKKGDKVLLVGFGVGYSWGAVVIEI